MFTRLQVTRVSIKRQGHRGRNTLIGLGVGAGVGLAIGLAARQGFFDNDVTAGGIVGGALIGTLIGVAIPNGGWRDVYRQ